MDTLEGASAGERRLMRLAEAQNIPLTGSMELLPLCNMNCDMCYIRLSKPEMEAQGRMRTGEEWLELGRRMAQAGTLFLLLTGGEPLLHPDFKQIYLGLKKLGMVLTINTNATLIDEEWAEFFGSDRPRRINITLYGADDRAYEELCHCPGGFDRVIRAVKLLRRNGVDVKLSGSITPANVDDIPRMLAIGQELGVPVRMDAYMMPAARERSKPFDCQNRLAPEAAAAANLQALRGEMGEELFGRYRMEALKRVDSFVSGKPGPCGPSCHGGRCSFTVNWQGQLRPCVVLTEPAAPVFEMDFQEAWDRVSREFQALRYCSDCSVCSRRPLCRVCAAAPVLETGDHMAVPEYLCRYAAESERLLREMPEAGRLG